MIARYVEQDVERFGRRLSIGCFGRRGLPAAAVIVGVCVDDKVVIGVRFRDTALNIISSERQPL